MTIKSNALTGMDRHFNRQLHICEIFCRCEHCGADPEEHCVMPSSRVCIEPHGPRIKTFNRRASGTDISLWDVAQNVEASVTKNIQNARYDEIARRLENIEIAVTKEDDDDDSSRLPRGSVFVRLHSEDIHDPVRIEICIVGNTSGGTRFRVVDWSALSAFSGLPALSDWVLENYKRFMQMPFAQRVAYARAHGEPLKPGAPPPHIPHLPHLEPR